MATQQFDSLHNIEYFRVCATEWFDKMDVPKNEKKKRVDLAIDYCEIIIMLFLMITEQEATREECVAFTEERLKVIAERELGKENIAYIDDWSKKTADRIVSETYSKYENEIEDSELEEQETEEKQPEETRTIHLDDLDEDIPEKDYWTSDGRAYELGKEFSTTVYNFKELSDAIDQGKTRKTWMTENDGRVRATHDEVHGVEIPINEYFNVGNSVMLMPGDSLNGAELKEIANCRCHLVCH